MKYIAPIGLIVTILASRSVTEFRIRLCLKIPLMSHNFVENEVSTSTRRTVPNVLKGWCYLLRYHSNHIRGRGVLITSSILD